MNDSRRPGVSEDDQALADAVARYAVQELAPRAQQLDEQAQSATCHVPGLAQLGLLGINLPLLPIAAIAEAGGPMNAMPASAQALAKPSFSDRKP